VPSDALNRRLRDRNETPDRRCADGQIITVKKARTMNNAIPLGR
jgi:hypothetical protein